MRTCGALCEDHRGQRIDAGTELALIAPGSSALPIRRGRSTDVAAERPHVLLASRQVGNSCAPEELQHVAASRLSIRDARGDRNLASIVINEHDRWCPESPTAPPELPRSPHPAARDRGDRQRVGPVDVAHAERCSEAVDCDRHSKRSNSERRQPYAGGSQHDRRRPSQPKVERVNRDQDHDPHECEQQHRFEPSRQHGREPCTPTPTRVSHRDGGFAAHQLDAIDWLEVEVTAHA